jgi:small subunit ribosomal protein S7
MRWVIDAARKRGENSMPAQACCELLEAREKPGAAVKKREETHAWRKPTRRSRTTAGKSSE